MAICIPVCPLSEGVVRGALEDSASGGASLQNDDFAVPSDMETGLSGVAISVKAILFALPLVFSCVELTGSCRVVTQEKAMLLANL